jgi:hypothetical protein
MRLVSVVTVSMTKSAADTARNDACRIVIVGFYGELHRE